MQVFLIHDLLEETHWEGGDWAWEEERSLLAWELYEVVILRRLLNMSKVAKNQSEIHTQNAPMVFFRELSLPVRWFLSNSFYDLLCSTTTSPRVP